MAETKKIACFYFIKTSGNESYKDALVRSIEENGVLTNIALLKGTIEAANCVKDEGDSFPESPQVHVRNLCTLAMQLVHRHAYKVRDPLYIAQITELIEERMTHMKQNTEDYMRLDNMFVKMTADQKELEKFSDDCNYSFRYN